MLRKPASPSGLDQYRLALLPAVQTVTPAECCAALLAGGSTLLSLVLSQGLGPLWHHRLQPVGLQDVLPAETIAALRSARLAAVLGYLPQRAALAQIDNLFEEKGIAYLVVKGAHVRECVYPDAALRSACDIDILIAPQDRLRTARLLFDLGYTYRANADTISHEALFIRAPVHIDLHWHLMRPGRTRVVMTEGVLARRQRVNGIWGLCDNDAFFLMLVHPAFAKYVCSPNMGLGRVPDFMLWVQHKTVDWPAVRQLLDLAGVKTAAWTMLSWFQMLAPPDLASTLDPWLDSLHPGRWRAAYLRAWLTRELPTRWIQQPLLIQAGFTLPLHDRMSDAMHALQGLWQAWRHRVSDARLLLGDDTNGAA